MRIIRDAAPNWNHYGQYTTYPIEPNDIQSWHLQTWQGWNPKKSKPNLNQPYYRNARLKYSYFCVSKTIGEFTIIWNTASECIVVLSSDEKEELDKYLNTKCAQGQLAYDLFKQGVLVQEDDEEFSKFNYIRQRAATKDSKIKNFIIVPTTECNARCFYCFAEKNLKTQKKMTVQTADEVVEFISSNINMGEEVVFRWFGGEPLIATDMIDYIIDRFNAYFNEKIQYHSIITSNASLLTNIIIDRAITRWHLRKIHLTIDGYREEHDRRKQYLVKGIDQYGHLLKIIPILLDKGIDTVVRLNLDKHNIDSIDKILDDLDCYKDNNHIFIHLTNLQPNDNVCNPDSYFTFTDYVSFYKLIYEKLICKGFYKNIDTLFPKRQMTLCTAGLNNFVLINNDGHLYKCDKECHIEHNCIGSCKEGIIHNARLAYWMDTSLESECKKCRFLPVCQGGCKYYRERNNELISPCIKQKYFSDILLELALLYFK